MFLYSNILNHQRITFEKKSWVVINTRKTPHRWRQRVNNLFTYRQNFSIFTPSIKWPSEHPGMHSCFGAYKAIYEHLEVLDINPNNEMREKHPTSGNKTDKVSKKKYALAVYVHSDKSKRWCGKRKNEEFGSIKKG